MYKILKKLIEMDDYSIQRLGSRSKLPKEYQQVDYIESNGTQYIDTGLIGTDLTDSEIELTIKNNTNGLNQYNFNGAYQTGKSTQMGTVAKSNTTCRSSINFGFTDAVGIDNLDITQFHKLYAKNGLQKVNDAQVGIKSFGSLNEYPFLLFARTNVTGTTTSIDFNKGSSISSFWVKKNGKYIRNLIPCYRKNDNEIGLYDLSATSKNLWNYTIEQGGYTASAGTIPAKVDNPIRCRVGSIVTIPSRTMSLTCSNNIKINFVWIDSNGYSLGGSGFQYNGSTVTVPNNATSLTFILAKIDDTNCTPSDFQNIMLNEGSTALPYEPYQKRFYTNDGTGEFGYEYKGRKVEPSNVS